MKRKKYHSIMVLQMVIIFLLSCSGNRNKDSIDVSKQEIVQPSPEIAMLIKKWQSDSLGCQKLRTKQLAETIIDSLHLVGKIKAEFVKSFGIPNKKNERESGEVISYYFNGICREGKFIDSSDYCIAEFTFKEEKLISRNYICQ